MGLTANPSTPALDLEDARQLVARVAESERFQKSPRLRELLLYVATCTFENRLHDTREQVIAERVFGRKPEFSGQDSIVRAEARNLRKRLEVYFSTEGGEEETIIIMPKGGYSLAFLNRSAEPTTGIVEAIPLVPEAKEAPEVGELSKSIVPPPGTRARALGQQHIFAVSVLALVALLWAASAAFWYSQTMILRNRLGADQASYLFSALFNNQQNALIVTSDTGMLQISSLLLHREISLDEYVSRNYPAIPATNPPDLLRNWNIYEFTDGREMIVANLLLSRNAAFASHIALRSGHSVQLQDFKDNNVVLIGSPISNPWAQPYEEKLNFRCELAPEGRIVFRNLSPHAKEAQRFPSDDDNQHHRTYARLVFLPGTTNARAALLIAGTTAQATQSGGELVADHARLSRVLQSMKVDPTGQPRFFELLIRVDNFVDGAILPEVTAWRLSPMLDR